jgi:hypothetical protein
MTPCSLIEKDQLFKVACFVHCQNSCSLVLVYVRLETYLNTRQYQLQADDSYRLGVNRSPPATTTRRIVTHYPCLAHQRGSTIARLSTVSWSVLAGSHQPRGKASSIEIRHPGSSPYQESGLPYRQLLNLMMECRYPVWKSTAHVQVLKSLGLLQCTSAEQGLS